MKVNRIRQNVLPVIAAFIWGTAFVAQSIAAEYVSPFTFNAARAVIAFFFLLGLCVVLRVIKRKQGAEQPTSRKDLLIGGIFCGTALAVATNLQQKGIETTTSGKAGFITALYIVLVPIAGIFLNRKAGKLVWMGVVLAVSGLYCLCITEEFTIATGDFYLLGCAVCFTVQIMAIDHFAQKVDGVELSCAQFFVVAIISTVGMLITETPTIEAILHCLLPILYVSIFSSGIAYTLQILAQKDSNPTVVTLLLSLESVFATIAGAVILHDQLSPREYLGCGLMLLAVILAQLPERNTKES